MHQNDTILHILVHFDAFHVKRKAVVTLTKKSVKYLIKLKRRNIEWFDI